MVNTLAYVQNAVGWSLDAAQGKFKDFQRWLVGLCLLGRYDLVELDAELGARAREQVVINI